MAATLHVNITSNISTDFKVLQEKSKGLEEDNEEMKKKLSRKQSQFESDLQEVNEKSR